MSCLCGGKTGPATLSDCKEFGDQQPPDLVVVLRAEDVLDLAMCLGVVGAVLHKIDLVGPDGKGFQGLIEARATDEHLGIVAGRHHGRGCGRRHVYALWLAVPDVGAAVADGGKVLAPYGDIKPVPVAGTMQVS